MSEKLAQAVKIQGHWIVYGALDVENLGGFPWWTAFTRTFHFHVYKVFDFTGNRHLGLVGDEAAFNRAKAFIAAGLADGSFPLTIDRQFQGLESLPEAMHYMASNQTAGKIIVSL
ncbi:zinc-binding dehydrogenase [Altericista sp. CCNU0014]|uniref:zinc-binding dehydrogenase n=1 Tax=Altericista sp. CCNU0014 TaxID=3082949 RepID=UPI00384E9B04